MRSLRLCLVLAASLVLVTGCSKDEDNSGPTAPADPYQAVIDEFDLGGTPVVPYPENNRFNPERIALGQLLFFDPILGGESAPWIKVAAGKDPYRFRANDVACATCHHPKFAFADGRRLGAGVSGAQFNDTDLGPQRAVPGPSLVTGLPVGMEPRNSMTILNAACNGSETATPSTVGGQFMDSRALGLEDQAKLPITSREEMAGDAYGRDVLGDDLAKEVVQDSVAARVRAISEYVTRFKQAFPGEITEAGDITIDHIARAIAAYERELFTPYSRYDRFVGGDRDAYSPVEKDGFLLFFGQGLCGRCHNGPMLSDYTFRFIGVGDAYPPDFPGKNGQGGDWGRYHADPVRFAGQKLAFRNLSIRNVELTAPYFHSGSAGTLREVVEFYNRGGRGPEDISDAELAGVGAVRDSLIRPLGLTGGEINAIVAFMRTTTSQVQQGPLGTDLTGVPQRVPSGLVPPGIPTPPGPGPFAMDANLPPISSARTYRSP